MENKHKRTNNKCIILATAPQRFGGLEVLFPIVNEIISKGHCYKALLFYPKGSLSHSQAIQDPIFCNLQKKIFNKTFFCQQSLSYAISILCIITAYIKNLKVLWLAPEGSDGKIIRLLSKLKHVNILFYPKVTNVTINDKSPCDASSFGHLLMLQKHPNAIGYPKFYSSWQKIVSSFNDDRIANKKHITIFLPSTVEGIFSHNELETWIKDILFIFDRNAYIPTIILKPHPMLDVKDLNKLINPFNSSNNITIEFGNALTALNTTTLAITHHSSVILDCLAMNVPVIFYQKFTEHWQKRHPSKSHFLNLGALHVESKNELEETIINKAYLNYSNKYKFFDKIQHKEGLIEHLIEKEIL